MVICIIALVVFAVLGIFSAKYRILAREAFDCVFRRVTLRPCNTGFDAKMKGKITGRLMQRSTRLASFAYKYFEVFSWIFTILMIVSLVLTAQAFYNLAVYGTCDPQSGSCVLSPLVKGAYIGPNATNCDVGNFTAASQAIKQAG